MKDVDPDSLVQNPFYEPLYYMVSATESQRKEANLLMQNDFQSMTGEQSNFIYRFFPQSKSTEILTW